MGGFTNSLKRRMCDVDFVSKYFVGDGIDIGAGNDNINSKQNIFNKIKSCRLWDLKDGDATYLKTLEDNSFDFIHSSHCLEHLENTKLALENWIRVCKKGGYLIVTVPDEDLYEQGIWPSRYNYDHKHSFTIYKSSSWCPKSVNVLNLLADLSHLAEIEKIHLIYSGWEESKKGRDQTLQGVECNIEFILKKK